MAVVLVKDFDVSQMNIEKTSSGMMISYGKLRTPLYLQTPDLYVPYGVTRFQDGSSSIEAMVDLHEFFEILVAIDNKVLQTCTDHSKAWFGEHKNRECMSQRFKPLVKMPVDENSLPTVRIKIPLSPAPKVFDHATKQPLALSDIGRGAIAKFIVHLRSVWTLDEAFGTSLRLSQAAVMQRGQHVPEGFAFLDDEGL